MNSIDVTSSALYFSAAANSANNTKSNEVDSKNNLKKVKKSFSNFIEEKKEENFLISNGLPVEIAGMSENDAVGYLKDQMDIAGDDLGINATPQAYEKYKKAVGQFIKFLEKNNYEVKTIKRKPRRGKQVLPAYQVVVINERLDRLAYDLWYNHLDKLKLLEKIHEINGLVIDLMAA